MLDGRLHRPPHLYATVRVAILAGILFLSGIGSLIFATLWLRLSGLSFGNSVWAAALILSSLAAGLASCIAAAIALLVSKRDGDTAALIPERAVPLRLDVSYRPPWRLLC